jgi:RsiW-degrading membrane proteinase PrsW (M82 family)
MSSAPSPAANPQAHPHPGYRTALVLVFGLLVAMFLGSAIVAEKHTFARLQVGGLTVVGLAAVGTYILFHAFDHVDAGRRNRHIRAALVILGAGLVVWLLIVAAISTHNNIGGALAALPFTAVAVLVIRHLDRYEKEPWRLVLVVLFWGGVVATNLALLFNSLFGIFFVSQFYGLANAFSNAFGAGLVEELAKGSALVLLYLVKPDEFDDVVDGIVYGAMVGIGFNFMETLFYMSQSSHPGNQLIDRQVIGLFAGHAAYTALIGAGLGIARQQAHPRQKAIAVASGFVIAIAAHFTWDAITFIGAFPVKATDPENSNTVLLLQTIVVDGPFIAMSAVLFYVGLRVEGKNLREQLQVEAATGLGAVLPEEVDGLVNPRARAGLRRQALGQGGRRRYQLLRKLQKAQLDLALERWHRSRNEIDEPMAAEDNLRAQVLALRAAAGA